MDRIRTRTIATLLAKESMALVFNLRDSNRLAGLEWDCVPNIAYDEKDITKLDVCAENLITWQKNTAFAWVFGVSKDRFMDIRKVSYMQDDKSMFESTRLSLMSGSAKFPIQYYATGIWGMPTSFARYILFTWVVENGVVMPKDKLIKVESHVLYHRWTTTGEVVLESFIWNY